MTTRAVQTGDRAVQTGDRAVQTGDRAVPAGHRGARAGRGRDATATKEALLDAARTLFGQKGFERTTTREIGETAGVDAALIARYFGSKAELYVAAVAAERRDDQDPQIYQGFEDMAETIVRRVDQQGPGPLLQALIGIDTPEEIRAAARAYLTRRLIDPLVAAGTGDPDDRPHDDRVDRPRLRAEIAVSALIGVSLGRALGWFAEMGTTPRAELIALLVDTIEAQGRPTR